MQLDTKLVEYYQTLIKQHQDIADTYRESLEALYAKFGKPRNDNQSSNTELKQRKPSQSSVNPDGSLSFRDKLINLLDKAGKPLTAAELRELFNNTFNADFSSVNFSPRLSAATGKLIKKHIEPKNPIEARNYYGLEQWFQGGELKNEYKEKIKSRQQGRLL